jgi:hypothetical protein
MERGMGAWDLAFEPILARKGGLTIGKASPGDVLARGGREGAGGDALLVRGDADWKVHVPLVLMTE